MATNKAIDKDYLLAQLKGYDSKIAQPEFIAKVQAKTTPNTGYLKTYEVIQGKQADGSDKVIGEIDIPKDFLLKSATVETCTVPDTPIAGLVVGDKYIDMVVNVEDSSATAQHVYIAIKDMVTAYTVEASAKVVQLAISATNEISAVLVDGGIERKKIDTAFEKNIADLEATHAKETSGDYKSVATEIGDAVGNLGNDKSGNPYTTVKAYVDDAVAAGITWEDKDISFETEW